MFNMDCLYLQRVFLMSGPVQQRRVRFSAMQELWVSAPLAIANISKVSPGTSSSTFRPDITVMAGWALNINYLSRSIYFYFLLST